MLTDNKIKAEAALGSSYIKGDRYYREGHVEHLRFTPDSRVFEAYVKGRERYPVFVQLDSKHNIQHYECECPAFYGYNGACKHVIAVLMAIQKDWDKYFGANAGKTLHLSRATEDLLAFFQHSNINHELVAAKNKIKLIPTYCISLLNNGKRANWLEFSIGTERMYVLKNIPQMLEALETNQEIVYGKNFTLKPQDAIFDELSKTLLDILRHAYVEEKQRAEWVTYYTSPISAFSEARRFKLTNSALLSFLDVMSDYSFDVIINHEHITQVQIVSSRPPLKLSVEAIEGGLKLAMDLSGKVLYALDIDCQYLYHNNAIYKVDSVFSRYIRPLLKCFAETNKLETVIPAASVSDFVTAALPALETITPVRVDAVVSERFYKEPLEKHVYFDKFVDGMSARVEFRYGTLTINPNDNNSSNYAAPDGKWLLRSTIEENQLLDLFKRYNFSKNGDRLIQENEETTFDFLQEALPELREIAEVYYSDDFKHSKIKHAGKVSAGVRLNTETDMLEFSIQHDDISPKELMELLAAYKLKKRYHRLKDGTFVSLDAPEFQTSAKLIQELGLKSSDLEKQVIELPKYRALYLDSLVRETEGFDMERNSAFKKMVQDIREPQDIEYKVPKGIHGKLRGYQKTGFKWLKSLASYGLGGILADDMGLGKTLQVLTFILSEQEEASTPSLVIAPTSLIYNWQDEALKFAPDLKVMVISGLQSDRMEQLKSINEADLVVTSYGLIKRDIELYEKVSFRYCFLDEAQHVKNPNTLNAKSVKKIQAKNYFALTGTPIENTLTELWSIFDFIMPGYLRSHKYFTSRFEVPIVKNSDEKALQELSLHIKPFIMRRMKKAVLKELPEKIESKMSTEMTDEQSKLYSAWLMQAKAEFESEIKINGFEKSQIKILSLLTRLRQICCHPALFVENYQGGSGKMDMLVEIMKEAISGGHRALLFSQFTGMLDLIKQELAELDIPFHYLDGSTSAEERMKLVHAFNAGKKDVFLISLKAGGTGLNLTGADVVIHYDPWWNPAVEDQATDRAYRIGQKNSVQVYKLITKNTIEEKIYMLQQKKKEMIDTLIKPGENFLTKMNEAEIRELFSF